MITRSVDSLGKLLDSKRTERMPSLFIGHGSPMNALADNGFTKALERMGKDLTKPKAILCISAHWMTKGTYVTGVAKPQTIHDFMGFPQKLYQVQYPAPGDPQLAKNIGMLIKNPLVQVDTEWGLDHGTWAILKFMYPEAKIPVLQLSIDPTSTPDYHFKLGQEISSLRDRGVLIIGSGNIVHNLRQISWSTQSAPHSWALDFDKWVETRLAQKDFKSLCTNYLNSEAGRLSVPTPDHYYPFLTVLGSASSDEVIKTEYDEIQNASISMRCISLGA